MKKPQIQKIIFEEIANVIIENRAALIKKLKDMVRLGKTAGEVNNATRLLLKYGVKAKDIPKPQGLKGAAKSTALAKTGGKTTAVAKTADKATDVAKTADKATDVAKAAAKPAKAAKPGKAAAGVSGPVSGVAGAIRPGMKVPLTGVGSKVFKGRSLDDIAKELKMAAPTSGQYRNVDFFLRKALSKRRRLGLQNPRIATPIRPGLPIPQPGTKPWITWIKSGKANKWLKYAGMTAAAALVLGAGSMLTDDEGGDPNPGPIPPQPTPGPDDGGGAGGPDNLNGPNGKLCATVRGMRRLLKQKAEEITGKKGIRALRAIPLKGDDNSWVRVSYRKFFSKGKPVGRAAAEKARKEVVAQYGVELGCFKPQAGGDEGEVTKLTPDVAPGALSPGELQIDPSLGDIAEPAQPQLRGMGPKFQAMLRRYKGQRQTARKAIRQRNKIIRAVLGRPLRGQETFKGFMASPVGQRMPQRRKDKINEYEEFIDRISKDTAQLGIRLVNYLKRKNPQFSKRQLDAFIKGKPMFGSGETPADLPKAGERDVAMIGRSPEERAARPSDTTSGPPPALQESKQLDRMKLLAGIKNEDK